MSTTLHPTPENTADLRTLVDKALAAAEHGDADAAGRLEHAAICLRLMSATVKSA